MGARCDLAPLVVCGAACKEEGTSLSERSKACLAVAAAVKVVGAASGSWGKSGELLDGLGKSAKKLLT